METGHGSPGQFRARIGRIGSGTSGTRVSTLDPVTRFFLNNWTQLNNKFDFRSEILISFKFFNLKNFSAIVPILLIFKMHISEAC